LGVGQGVGGVGLVRGLVGELFGFLSANFRGQGLQLKAEARV
jgi:hypothetical protein